MTDVPVTLEEMLDARDARVARQQEALSRHACTLVSYSLNIPGPHKTGPAFAWAFAQEQHGIDQAIAQMGWPVLHRETLTARTGYEGLLAVQGDALEVKRALVAIEEASPLGRLFDIDVLRPDGTKVSRGDLGLPGRTCLICGEAAFVCARSRAHSLGQLLDTIETIIADAQHAQAAQSEPHGTGVPQVIFEARLARALRFALVEELDTTPKPGLVDRHDNGAHADMDHALFMRSVDAVVPHLARMGMAGYAWQDDLPGLFPLIQRIGVEAEADMFCATGGVNTHKGAIFTLGILAAAVGHLVQQSAPLTPALISQTASHLAAPAMQAQFAAMDEKKRLLSAGIDVPLTHGERIWCELGVKGIRQEAALGFPTVFTVALPHLADARPHDAQAFNAAKTQALLAVMEQLDDSNVISRAGLEGLAWVKRTAREVRAQRASLELLAGFNTACVARNISPGGAADLLGAALFIHAILQPEPLG